MYIADEHNDKQSKENLSKLAIWVCKGLVLRWHKFTLEAMEDLFALLSHDKVVGSCVGEHFGIILHDYSDCLTKEMHSNIKLMYKQRFTETVLPRLVHGYEDAEALFKPNFLMAMSRVLQQLPKLMLGKHMPPVSSILEVVY